jgi:hypothetical protein
MWDDYLWFESSDAAFALREHHRANGYLKRIHVEALY